MQAGVILFSVYSAGTQLSVFYCSSEYSRWAKTDSSPVIFQTVIADQIHQVINKAYIFALSQKQLCLGTVHWQKADCCWDCRLAEMIYFFFLCFCRKEWIFKTLSFELFKSCETSWKGCLNHQKISCVDPLLHSATLVWTQRLNFMHLFGFCRGKCTWLDGQNCRLKQSVCLLKLNINIL